MDGSVGINNKILDYSNMTKIGTYTDVKRQINTVSQLTGYDGEVAPEHVVLSVFGEHIFRGMKKDANTWICWYNDEWYEEPVPVGTNS